MGARSTTRLLAIGAAIILIFAACSSGSSSGGGAADCSALAKSRAVSEACCPAHGVDACGALLFCAAFDGRTVATCYPERSRADMSECGDDRHCTSGSCNTEVGKCRSLFGQACVPDVGCATAPDGKRYACDLMGTFGSKNTCRAITGTPGGLCGVDDDCTSKRCALSTCTNGRDGEPCDDAGDCESGRCFSNRCVSGSLGTPCGGDPDCAKGACIEGTCQCRDDSDCSGGATCKSGVCCTPACSGKTCGPDGCGGTCGTCGSGTVCSGTTCKPLNYCANEKCLAGEDCCPGAKVCRSTPISRPYTVCAATCGAFDDYCRVASDCCSGNCLIFCKTESACPTIWDGAPIGTCRK